MLLLQLAIDPSNLPPPPSPAPSPAAQEPGMPLVPLLRPLLEGSSCVGTQQAIASQRGITPPQNLITLQMLMQRAGVPAQVRRN